MTTLKTIRVRDLQERLEREVFPFPDAELIFGAGDISFYRPKNRGYASDGKTPTLIQIEFNEVYTVTADPDSAS
jgi:hypothetical protein